MPQIKINSTILKNSSHITTTLLRHLHVFLKLHEVLLRLVSCYFNGIQQITTIPESIYNLLREEVSRLRHQILQRCLLIPALLLSNLGKVGRTETLSIDLKIDDDSVFSNNPIQWITHLFKRMKERHLTLQVRNLLQHDGRETIVSERTFTQTSNPLLPVNRVLAHVFQRNRRKTANATAQVSSGPGELVQRHENTATRSKIQRSTHYFSVVSNSGAAKVYPVSLLTITSKQYIIISFFTTDMIHNYTMGKEESRKSQEQQLLKALHGPQVAYTDLT